MGQLKQQTMIDATEERKNRFNGQSILLTPHEAKIHDDIFINELSATLEDKKVGIDGLRVFPHKFRHTFATRAFQNEANVYTVKEIMGHSSLQTTQKYTHPQPEDLKKQHNRFSPVADQMGKKP